MDALIEPNARLNATYVAFWVDGAAYASRQVAQDANAAEVSKRVMAKRAVSKAGRLYKNSSWDLVDALDQGQVDLTKVKPSARPEALRGKTPQEIEAFAAEMRKEREAVKQQIAKRQRERETYVAEKTAELAKQGDNTLDDVIIAILRKQAEAKGFTFPDI